MQLAISVPHHMLLGITQLTNNLIIVQNGNMDYSFQLQSQISIKSSMHTFLKPGILLLFSKSIVFFQVH